ncbi:MAG TPA: diversity-generating retroelement protein Avd [Candidatus Nanoarchaeia archaeon]
MSEDLQFLPPKSSNSDVPIFQKLYDFYKELYLTQLKFPKAHKYTLGQTLGNNSLELFELLFLAGRRQDERLELLEKADAKLESLKTLLRLAKDTQCIDNNKYLHLESFLQEIGKMLGGWIRHTKQNAQEK